MLDDHCPLKDFCLEGGNVIAKMFMDDYQSLAARMTRTARDQRSIHISD